MLSSLLLADIGLPMILVVWPIAWIGFIPIVILEAWVMARRLGVPYRHVDWTVVYSNLVSTLLGLPLAWYALVLLQMKVPGGGNGFYRHPQEALLAVTVGAAWMVPGRNTPVWEFPVANLVLLLPFYVVSSVIEDLVNRWRLGWTREVTKATWLANLASYGLLAAFWLVVLLTALRYQLRFAS